MSIELRDNIVLLLGRCGVEDAELLLQHLAAGASKVDVGDCSAMHAAILQLLLAGDVELIGTPPEFIARWSILDRNAATWDPGADA